MFMGCIEIRPSEQTDEKSQLDAVPTVNNNTKKWTQQLKISNGVLTVRLDTGAERNMLSMLDLRENHKKGQCTTEVKM